MTRKDIPLLLCVILMFALPAIVAAVVQICYFAFVWVRLGLEKRGEQHDLAS